MRRVMAIYVTVFVQALVAGFIARNGFAWTMFAELNVWVAWWLGTRMPRRQPFPVFREPMIVRPELTLRALHIRYRRAEHEVAIYLGDGGYGVMSLHGWGDGGAGASITDCHFEEDKSLPPGTLVFTPRPSLPVDLNAPWRTG